MVSLLADLKVQIAERKKEEEIYYGPAGRSDDDEYIGDAEDIHRTGSWDREMREELGGGGTHQTWSAADEEMSDADDEWALQQPAERGHKMNSFYAGRDGRGSCRCCEEHVIQLTLNPHFLY